MADGDSQAGLRMTYGVLGRLHSTVISTRFSIAGLYIAALAFLASSLPSESASGTISGIGIAWLGVGLSVALWTLEIRNHCLLINLEERGRKIESKIYIGRDLGLFQLMENQPLGPRIPFLRVHMPYARGSVSRRIVAYIFSHSTGLSMLYVLGIVFWVWILCS